MRISIEAQSWLSVPPAPELIFEHHAHVVLLTPEHVAQLQDLDFADSVGIEGVDLLLRHEFLLDELECGGKLVDGTLHFGITVDPRLEVLYLLHLSLRLLGVLPEIRHMSAQLLFFYLDYLAVDVKGTSSAPACAPTSLSVVLE